MTEFDAYRTTYEEEINRAVSFSGKSHDFFLKVKAELLLEYINLLTPAGEHLEVLDVGCGHGAMHRFMLGKAKPMRLTGVDVAEQVIDMAKESNPGVRYLSYDGVKLPFADASFDAAFTVCVMHHVPPSQWLLFLAEMHRVVRRGGVVAIAEHNPLNPLTSWIVRTCPLDQNAVLVWPKKLLSLMRQAGFKEIDRRFILFTPFDVPLAAKLDRGLAWLPLGAQYVAVGRVP